MILGRRIPTISKSGLIPPLVEGFSLKVKARPKILALSRRYKEVNENNYLATMICEVFLVVVEIISQKKLSAVFVTSAFNLKLCPYILLVCLIKFEH